MGIGRLFSFLFFISIYMAKEVRPEIKHNYALYEMLLKGEKGLNEGIIVKHIKRSNSNYLEDNTNVTHYTLKNNISLITTVKRVNNKYFTFNLRCLELSEKR